MKLIKYFPIFALTLSLGYWSYLKLHQVKDITHLSKQELTTSIYDVYKIDGNKLLKEKIELNAPNKRAAIAKLIDILREDHAYSLNAEYKVDSIFIKDDICFLEVNINKPMYQEDEYLFVYSIVNTVSGLGFTKVRFLGNTVLRNEQFFEFNQQLVRKNGTT